MDHIKHLIDHGHTHFGGGYVDKNNNFHKIGSCKHSDAAIFSFHPIKTITTGEGGALTTNNADVIKKFKLLRSHSFLKDCFSR